MKLNHDPENIIRSVNVKFKGGIFKRSLNKIARLEITPKLDSIDHVDHESDYVE